MDLSPNTYQKLAAYPHMKPYDVEIWNRFIEKYPDAYRGVLYDFCVGTGTEMPDEIPAEWQPGLAKLGKYKIDVVGFSDGFIDIIEIKPRAGMKAIGQALCYARLFTEEYDTDEIVVPTIITDLKLPDMDLLAEHHGIKLYIV